MLKAEVSRRRKAFALLNDIVWFVAGAAWTFSNTNQPSQEDLAGPVGKSTVEIILGIGLMTFTSISFVHDWCFRRIHTRLRANSRTVAIIGSGRQPTYIKRVEVVAAAHCGYTLILSDGSRHSLSMPWDDIGGRFEYQFLSPLYDLWWPTCPLHRVRRVLGEKGPTFAEARANLFHFDGPEAQENWDLIERGAKMNNNGDNSRV